MTESQGRQTTKCSSTRKEPRSLWRKRKAEERALWRQQNPRVGSLTFTGRETPHTAGQRKFEVVCDCGEVFWRGWSDLQANLKKGDGACISCARRNTMRARMQTPEGREHQRRMTEISSDSVVHKWTAEERRVARRMSSARQRCINPNNAAYENYGGRGVEFRFESVDQATRWVLANLGAPKDGESIDRIGNNGHYEPGNLRWASRTDQIRNRRAYKNALVGLPLARALRPDLSDSQLRLLIKRGVPMAEIAKWEKYKRRT